MIEELKKKLEKLNFALWVGKIELNSCYTTNYKAEVARLEKFIQLRTERDEVSNKLQQLLNENNGSTQTNS
jgi:xylose isomerase